MGDRYILQVICPCCGNLNKDVYYASTCDFTTHICDFCNRKFEVGMVFYGKTIEDVPHMWGRNQNHAEKVHAGQ